MSDATMVVVSRLTARTTTLDCPKCNAEQNGWVGDPRGQDHQCDACGTEFHVAQDADINLI